MRHRRRIPAPACLAIVLGLLALGPAVSGCGGSGSPGKAADAQKPAPTASHAGSGRRADAPVPRSAPGAHPAPRERVPILMYHVIERAPPGTPSPGLWVPREEFKAQVDALAARGYHAVTLQQVWSAWRRGGLLPSKPIVFSFDDGYTSQYTNAMPILRAHGWSGVLNLEVATLHTTLRPTQVRGLIRAGWEIDAHSMTHPDLTKTYGAKLRYEVAESRRWIRSRFGVPVNFFCYPAGRFDARVAAAVKAAGYAGATTTNVGSAAPSQPPYALQRVRVNAGDGAAGLERNLQAAASGATSAKRAGE